MFVTLVYDDAERSSIYQNVPFFILSKSGYFEHHQISVFLHKFRETILHSKKYQLI